MQMANFLQHVQVRIPAVHRQSKPHRTRDGSHTGNKCGERDVWNTTDILKLASEECYSDGVCSN